MTIHQIIFLTFPAISKANLSVGTTLSVPHIKCRKAYDLARKLVIAYKI